MFSYWYCIAVFENLQQICYKPFTVLHSTFQQFWYFFYNKMLSVSITFGDENKTIPVSDFAVPNLIRTTKKSSAVKIVQTIVINVLCVTLGYTYKHTLKKLNKTHSPKISRFLSLLSFKVLSVYAQKIFFNINNPWKQIN